IVCHPSQFSNLSEVDMRNAGKTAFSLSLALATFAATSALAAPQCYTRYGGTKPNKLYLYFPTASDPSYPEFAAGTPNTSPAHAFNIADLPNFTAISPPVTAAQLQSAIYDVVADDYCG